MADRAENRVETTQKTYEPSPDERKGWAEASPVMPEVVEGPLEPPPLTAPTVPPQKHDSDH
jgi:hypothetical protein